MTRNRFQSRSIGFTTIGFLASLGIGSAASAAPLPGEQLKFQQLPLGVTTTNSASQFSGHDELSTATSSTAGSGFNGVFAADDFSDNVTSPVVDVQWWGSYPSGPGTTGQVQNFLVAFEADVPANAATPYSQPGQVLSAQVVTLGALAPASGTFTETPVPSVPGPDGQVYQYNTELRNPFPEQAGVTYWLKIVALTGPNSSTKWGWHNRDYTIPDPYAAPPGDSIVGTNVLNQPVFHYLDDAVTGTVAFVPGVQPPFLSETNISPLSYDGTNPALDGFAASGVTPPSEDLSFALYYVPEPASLPLLAMGFSLFRRSRRRTHASSTDTGLRESVFQLPELLGGMRCIQPA